MSTDFAARLRFGGAVPATASVDEALPLVAARFTGGLLRDRVVVRLVAEPLVPAEDSVAATFGLSAGAPRTVGQVRTRAIGFPAWVIMHDPEQATNALNIAARLRQIEKRAKSKPGNARDAIESMAVGLASSEPGFLPTYYEEAGRMFVRCDNLKYAATMFGKARQAEKTHGLPVDEERHQQALMEFALAGAITAKVMTAEARDVAERHEPHRAYELFRALNVARVRGGLAPYADLPKDLDRLAAAAGLDVTTQRRSFLVELLATDDLESATSAFWASYRDDIGAAVRAAENPGGENHADEQSAAIRRAIVDLHPRLPVEDWLEFLDGWGLLDALDTHDLPRWLQQVFNRLHRWNRGLSTPRLTALIERCGARLRGHTFSVPRLGALSLSTIDALLEAGADVTERLPGRRLGLGLRQWAKDPQRRDLRWVVADRRFRPDLIRQVAHSDVLPIALQYSTLQELLRTYADEQLAPLRLRPLSVKTVETALAALHALRAARELLAEQFATITSVALAEAELLADTLRLGVGAELTWPAAEQVWAEFRPAPTANFRPHVVHDAWPAMGFGTKEHIRFIDGDQVVASSTYPHVTRATLIDGQLGVIYFDRRHYLRWGADEPVEIRHVPQHSRHLSLPVTNGRLMGTTLVRTDSTRWAERDAAILSDGSRVWVWPTAADCYEVDPQTGRSLGTGLPPWFVAQQQRFADRPELHLRHEALFRPVTPTTAHSAVSTSSGMHAAAVFADRHDPQHWVVVAADGTALEYRSIDAATPIAPMLRPGGGLWMLTDHHTLRDLATGQELGSSSTADGQPHLFERNPQGVWHHARPRDLAASQVLRQVSADHVRPLLKALTRPADPLKRTLADIDPQQKLAAAIERLLGRQVDPALIRTIAFVALNVSDVASRARSLDADPAPRAAAPATPASAIDPALDGYLGGVSVLVGNSQLGVGVSAAHVADQLGTRPKKAPAPTARDVEKQPSFGYWPQLIGREAALLYVAASPVASDDSRNQALAVFDHVVTYGYLDHSWTVRRIAQAVTVDQTRKPIDRRHMLVSARRGPAFALTASADVQGPVGDLATELTLSPSGPRDKAGLLRLAERIRAGERFAWSAEQVAELTGATGLSPAAASLLLTGLPYFHRHDQNFLPAEVRSSLGLKVADAADARTFFRRVRNRGSFVEVLAAAVPDDPERLLSDGPNVAALAAAWGGEPMAITLDAETQAELTAAFKSRTRPVNALTALPEELDSRNLHQTVEQLLWLAQYLPADAPARAQVAEQLAAAIERHPHVPDLREETLQLIQFAPAVVAQLQLPAQPGYWVDPQVSAPHLVQEVATQHGLSAEAAAYYLQLLALPTPTDVLIRRWNGWSPKKLKAARQELLDRELVVEGKRTRAGRSTFLPGAWVAERAPRPPMHAWTQRFQRRLWPSRRVNFDCWPVLTGDLFARAWQRAQTQPPSFDELATERQR